MSKSQDENVLIRVTITSVSGLKMHKEFNDLINVKTKSIVSRSRIVLANGGIGEDIFKTVKSDLTLYFMREIKLRVLTPRANKNTAHPRK